MRRELVQGMLNHCKNDLAEDLYVQTQEKTLAANFSAFNEKLELILDHLTHKVNQKIRDTI